MPNRADHYLIKETKNVSDDTDGMEIYILCELVFPGSALQADAQTQVMSNHFRI